MEIIIWIIVVLLFIGSLVGVFVPLIPDVLLLWGGFLVYRFFMAIHGLPLSFWIGMGAFTVLLILADTLANIVLTKKAGGSKWAMLGSVVGMIIGPFILGPFGILFGPLLFVFVMEWLRTKDFHVSFKVSLGTLAAFFGSAAVKVLIQLIMISWFFIIS